MVTILRVWALYNRSRLTLVVLLTFYAIELMLYVADSLVLSTKKSQGMRTCFHLVHPTKHDLYNLSIIVVIEQASGFSFCNFQFSTPLWVVAVTGAVQIALGALMCLLVIVRFVRESIRIYKAATRFELSRYVSLLTRDGVLYFFGYVVVRPFIRSPSANSRSQIGSCLFHLSQC